MFYSPGWPFPDVVLLVTVAEFPGLGDDSRLHRRLPEPKVSQGSQREPPLLRKADDGAQNSESGPVSDKFEHLQGRLRNQCGCQYQNLFGCFVSVPGRTSSRRRS